MNDRTTYDLNDKTPATPETEDQCLRERREEEREAT